MKTKILVLLALFVSILSNTQEKTGLKVYTFSEVDSLSQQKPKPIAVFIYTDWCKICYGMKKTTFKNKKVIQLLNDHFYFITLNGEEKKDLTFLGKTFVYKPTGTNTGIHELANELAAIQKRISYPTTTFLNSKFVIQLQINGLYSAKKMEKILSKLSKE
jgi:thioredoxin-related protein